MITNSEKIMKAVRTRLRCLVFISHFVYLFLSLEVNSVLLTWKQYFTHFIIQTREWALPLCRKRRIPLLCHIILVTPGLACPRGLNPGTRIPVAFIYQCHPSSLSASPWQARLRPSRSSGLGRGRLDCDSRHSRVLPLFRPSVPSPILPCGHAEHFSFFYWYMWIYVLGRRPPKMMQFSWVASKEWAQLFFKFWGHSLLYTDVVLFIYPDLLPCSVGPYHSSVWCLRRFDSNQMNLSHRLIVSNGLQCPGNKEISGNV